MDDYSYVILILDARMSDLEGRFQRLFEVINGEPTIPSRLQTLERSVQDLRVIKLSSLIIVLFRDVESVFVHLNVDQ